MLHGTLAASVTPLRNGGGAVDLGAVPPLVDFYVHSGLDGLLVLGTTGEGILLSIGERKETAAAFIASARGRLDVCVHCGAQNTKDTAELSAHAAAAGARAVAAIGPPYYAFSEESLYQHFAAAARACAPVHFYAYEFAARAGYGLSPGMLMRLRETEPNFAGVKVSNAAWDAFAPYLLPGLDIFVGPEALIERALAAGAKGAVSGLAAAFPKAVVSHVKNPTREGSQRIAQLRGAFDAMPFQAAAKFALALRGVPIGGDVRAPLQPLEESHKTRVREIVTRWKIL